jgi:DNA-binding MarR family transcriptional regulator
MNAIKENPGLSHAELAEIVGCDRSTIARDLRAISDELRIQTTEDFMLHRERVLREVQANKDECMRRLNACKNPAQGSRWMDEWNKLIEKEIRMLGLHAPEKLMLSIKDEFSKEERDAAVNAALAGMDDVIDVLPESIRSLPAPKETVQ